SRLPPEVDNSSRPAGLSGSSKRAGKVVEGVETGGLGQDRGPGTGGERRVDFAGDLSRGQRVTDTRARIQIRGYRGTQDDLLRSAQVGPALQTQRLEQGQIGGEAVAKTARNREHARDERVLRHTPAPEMLILLPEARRAAEIGRRRQRHGRGRWRRSIRRRGR